MLEMKQKLKEEIDKIDFFELAKQEKNPPKSAFACWLRG